MARSDWAPIFDRKYDMEDTEESNSARKWIGSSIVRSFLAHIYFASKHLHDYHEEGKIMLRHSVSSLAQEVSAYYIYPEDRLVDYTSFLIAQDLRPDLQRVLAAIHQMPQEEKVHVAGDEELLSNLHFADHFFELMLPAIDQSWIASEL